MSDWATSWSSQSLAQAPTRPSARLKRRLGFYATGLLALLASVPLAVLIARINAIWPNQPERATQIVGIVLAGLILLPPAVYLGVRRREATFRTLTLTMLASLAVVLVATYLYVVSIDIFFPADVLNWSESDFVNDILKFRLGYPIFTNQANNESYHYVPGAQLLTYGLAWLSGHPLSIAAYRLIQVGYSVLASIVAAGCCRQILRAIHPRSLKNELLWGAVWLPLLFLIATNSRTNAFSHMLHNDSLAQLVTVAAYGLLLRYAITGDRRLLWLMAIVPAAGFWVKQSLAIWAVLYCVQLAVFDQPRSFKRLLLFALAAFAGLGISAAVGYALWGPHFIYWVFTVAGRHHVSPLRSFKHVLDVWPYFAIGLIGGVVLLRGEKFKVLLGPWLIWLALISLEAYTSGIAWMMNHLGPGCLIAGVWFLAAFTVIWPQISDAGMDRFEAQTWLRVGAGLAIVCLLFSGLGIIRVPVRAYGDDAYRYVREIEREFQGQPSDRILLDIGTWVYVRDGVVMKDRAPGIGERGSTQTGDFSGIIQRLNEKRYAKIMVRNFHSFDFWYDRPAWPKSSGIRQAMMDNYRETGTIKQVDVQNLDDLPYGFSEISILVPREEINQAPK
jgi:uncharacterized membrane protein YhaH (DUF805 family)